MDLQTNPSSQSSILSSYPDSIQSSQVLVNFSRAKSMLDSAAVDVTLLHRFLDFMLPGTGRDRMAEDILRTDGDGKKLSELHEHLRTAILTPLLASGGRTAQPSPRPDSVDEINAMEAIINSSSRNEQASVRAACMVRDNYRCVVTKAVDSKYRRMFPNEHHTRLDLAHILPFALGKFNDNNREEVQDTATIWESLLHYFPEILDECGITAETINNFENVFMLASPFHNAFGRFEIYFDEDKNTPNTYRILTTSAFSSMFLYLLPSDRVMTLESHSLHAALPCRRLLQVHKVIAQVLDEGEGEQIEASLQILKEGRQLASDGSTEISATWWSKILRGWN